MNCILRGVRVIDPATGVDLPEQDVWLSEGRIIAMYRRIDEGTVPVVDLTRAPGQSPCILAPGFVDLHVHLRDPGDERAETVRSGARAAAAGGFTRVAAMANTDPPVDTPQRVEQARARAGDAPVQVMVVAAATRGLAAPSSVDVAGCTRAGAVAFSDDGRNAAPMALLAELLRRAADVSRPVLVHAEDEAMIAARNPGAGRRDPRQRSAGGSRGLGGAHRAGGAGTGGPRPPPPPAPLHRGVRGPGAPRPARRDGGHARRSRPHHLAMWLPAAQPPDPPRLLKVNPPLRDERDRDARHPGVARGRHRRGGDRPRAASDGAEARRRSPRPAPGMIGLETALATCITLGGMDGDWIPVLLERLTIGPAPRARCRQRVASPACASGRRPPACCSTRLPSGPLAPRRAFRTRRTLLCVARACVDACC